MCLCVRVHVCAAREVKLLKELCHHPNIVRLQDVFLSWEEQSMHLVYEYGKRRAVHLVLGASRKGCAGVGRTDTHTNFHGFAHTPYRRARFHPVLFMTDPRHGSRVTVLCPWRARDSGHGPQQADQGQVREHFGRPRAGLDVPAAGRHKVSARELGT